MLKIRMQRTGKINDPSYRIVVIEHARSPQAGNFLERLGTYNPKTKARVLETDRIKYWISVGAQPSDTMHNMLVSEGVITGKKINVLPRMPEPVAEATPEASQAPASETASVEEPQPQSSAAEEVAAETSAEQPTGTDAPAE